MKRLLLVAYYFPPIGGAGAQRPVKFAKYLPEFDWKVTIVAPQPQEIESQWAPTDQSLTLDTSGIKVHRVPQTESRSHWHPRIDCAQAWAESAFEKICRLISDEQFDAVLITMSPFSLSHLAIEIKKRFNINVIVDLRDPWALDGWYMYRDRLAWRRDIKIMRDTLRASDGVIANTLEASKAMKRFVPEVAESNWAVITNGFDQEDFPAEQIGQDIRERHEGDEFIITHAGTLHNYALYPTRNLLQVGKNWFKFRPEPILPAGRTLKYLTLALKDLLATGHSRARHVRIRCIGTANELTRRFVNESGIADRIQVTGHLCHDQSVNAILDSDALFLPLHAYKNRKRRSLIVPGKTYEYLASRLPVLACVPEGDARDLIQMSGRGYIAYPDDVGEISQALANLLDSCDAPSRGPTSDSEWLQSFSRRSLSQKLAEFMESLD